MKEQPDQPSEVNLIIPNPDDQFRRRALARDSEAERSQRRKCWIIIVSVLFPLIVLGLVLLLYLQRHVFENATAHEIVGVFQTNSAGLGFYFLLLAAGQAAILKTTNFLIFILAPLLIFLVMFAVAAHLFVSFAIPLVLILWAGWVLALLFVLFQIKTQKASNLPVSLILGVLFFVFSSIIIIALPLTFLSNRPHEDDNQRRGIKVVAFPLSAIIVLLFLSFHLHLFKNLRNFGPPNGLEVRRKKLIKCEISYIVLSSVAFCVFTMTVMFRLQDELVAGSSVQQRPIIFTLVTVPVFFLFSIELMRCLLPYRNRYLLYPLIVYFPLMFFSNLATNLGSGEYYYIFEAVALMSPILGVLFTTLLEIVTDSPRSCMLITALAKIGITMPFAYFSLLELNAIQITVSTDFVVAVGIASCLMILGIVGFNMYKFRQQSRKRKLCALASNYTKAGHWFNTTGFIFGEGILMYVGFGYDITSDLRYGFVRTTNHSQTYACGFGILLFFVVTNLVLEQRSYVPGGDQDSNFFDYVFEKVFQNLNEQDQVALRKDSISDTKFTLILLIVLLVIVPAALLPVGLAVSAFNEAVQTSLIISAGFSIIIASVGVAAMEVKKRLGPYSRNGLPICLSMIWIFVALPFLSFLPVATILTGGQQGSFQILVTSSLLVMAAFLVLGTSLLSVILNEVFRRIQYELKAKLAVIRLYEFLKTIAVKGEPMPLRACVDTYIWKGREELSNRLVAEDLVVVWELPPTDPDPSVSKVLVTKDFYLKMEKRSIQDKKRADYREMKVEEKFQKAVEKRRNEKKRMKQRIDRVKESARRRAERLERLINKEKKLKSLLNKSKENEGESISTLTSKDIDIKASTSIQSEPGHMLRSTESEIIETPRRLPRMHVEGVETFTSTSQFRKPEDEKEEDEEGHTEERKRELQEIKDALRGQNYRVLTNQNSSEEEKLVAVFELITDKQSVHTIQQLLKISTKPLDTLEKELFAYFAADQAQKKLERKELKLMFQVFEANSEVDEYLEKGEDIVNLKRFKEIIGELSFREYPAYTRNKARQLFLTGVVYYRLSYYQKEFAGHAFALYLLNSIRKEVQEIREKRIKEMLHIEEQEQEEYEEALKKEEQRELGKCRATCRGQSRKKCKDGCLKCLARVRNGLRWLTVKLVICCCFAGTNARHKELDSKEFQEEISEEELERLRPSQRRVQQMYEHRPSPEWKEISDHILEETKSALELYDPKRGLAWRCTMPNVVMLLIKIIEFFSFLSFMWGSDIPWNFSDSTSTALTAVNGDTAPSLQVYYYFYGLALALAILYTFLIRPAAIKARNGTLGMNKDGLPAKLCTRAFFFSKLVQFMSASFYTFIIKNLLDAFSCDFSNSNQAVLLKQTDVNCFSGAHFGLMGGALVGILAYYPFATFLYANLQFVNKDTDLKYNPQFMVYLAQAKLVFSSLSSFLHSSDTSLIVRLALMAATILFLALMSGYQQPCLVANANIFHTAGYLSVSYLIIMTIFIVLALDNTTIIIIMASGVALIWLVTITIACIKSRRRPVKAQPRREEYVPPPGPSEAQ